MKTQMDIYTLLSARYAAAPGSGIFNSTSRAAELTQAHPLLKEFAAGTASLAHWQDWGVQRYLISSTFEDFLENLLEKTAKTNLQNLREELAQNLREEKGIDDSGEINENDIHQNYRLNFFKALDLDEKTLNAPEASEATQKYLETIEEIKSDPNVWIHVGAFLAIEYTGGMEMKLVDAGLDQTPCLASRFNNQSETGSRDRLYVTHHADHDLEAHFPDLIDAVIADLKSQNSQEEILEHINQGAQKIIQARKLVYDSLEIDFENSLTAGI